ncbi:MAG: hypothetical protein JWL84_5139 [Rhodospirillales bacterium]|nr:hypothetical protein [Rhodospirillales bacterium]
MSLRASLASGAAPRGFAAPAAERLAGVARSLVERYGSSEAPRRSPRQLDDLLQRLRALRFDWNRVTAADRLDVAWVLWRGPQPPAEHPDFLRGFLDWLETPWRRVQARRMAISWAAAFDPDLDSIRGVGDWLAARADELAAPWSDLAATLDFFSVERGPAALAEAFLAADGSARDFLARLGIGGRTAAGGLLLATLGAAAELVETRLATAPRLAGRLVDLSLHRQEFRPAAMEQAMPRRATAIRQRIAEALLLPWERTAPPSEVMGQITAYLLRHYGDARVQEPIWKDLRPPCRSIMHRWLTASTIATFFRLSAQVDGGDDPKFAQDGLRFCRSYGDHVDDAWIVAGSKIAAVLSESKLGHGRLVGCRPDQFVLVLGLRGLTIAKPSHEAAWRVWLPLNHLAPEPYCGASQPCFPTALTNGADFSSSYSRKDDGAWQDRLHDFIKARTGLTVSRDVYLA